MTPYSTSVALRYGRALLAGALAFGLSLAMRSVMGQTVYIFYFAAVILIAAADGLGPGLLVTAMGLFAGNYLMTHPYLGTPPGFANVLRMVLFGLIGAMASVLSERRVRAEKAARQSEQWFRSLANEAEAKMKTAQATLTASVAEGSSALTEAAAALHDSEERYRLLIQETPDYAILLLDPEGRISSWNAGAERVKGYRAVEALGQPYEIFFTPEDRAAGKPARLMREALTNGRVEEEAWRIRKDGTLFWASISLTALYDKSGKHRGFGKITRDMTERRQTEEMLRRKEEELFRSRKLEAIGRLAGGVAHDFNNLLTGIIGLSEDLLPAVEGTSHAEDVRAIIHAADRASNLTRQLLAFARRQIVAPQVVRLNDAIHDMEKMLRRLIGEDVKLVVELDPATAPVRTDPGQIEQVIINLVLNARDAMPQGGQITLQTANVVLSEAEANIREEMTGGAFVRLTVSDTGAGMDQETVSHAFEPFFTTKSKEKGSGLGLATVYGIIKQNGGDIAIQSAPGKGTRFDILLPRAPVETSNEKNGSETAVLRGHETILLTEDEEIVRTTVARTLEQQGYHVLQAIDAESALKLAEAHPQPIHLLLTDVVMSGMNGRQLAERLKGSRPSMKVLYMSGYPEDVIVRRGILEPGIFFLEKSFTTEDLRAKVRGVLDGTVQTA